MKNVTYLTADQLFPAAMKKINNIDVILDVGCGIRPQTLTRAFVHICVDAHKQYLEVLKKNVTKEHAIKGRLKFLCINKTTHDIVSQFPDKVVDTIFLLDVIEHLDKEHGLELMKAFSRIARHQVVIFTPLGFVEQEHPDGKDAWGLDGGKWQQHRSGWTPDDFDNSWEFLVCKDFHKEDNMGHEVEPFGAFFAIKTMSPAPDSVFNKSLFAKIKSWFKSYSLYKRLKNL